jgi:HKD family nuclease
MIIDNRETSVKNVLCEWINKSDEVLICSPFITSTDLLFDLLEREIKFTLICRLSHPATPELFLRMNTFAHKNNNIYLYDDNSLHSKVYFFKNKGKRLGAIVGSSNFTDSGIYSNKEFNLFINSDLDKIEEYFKFLIDESYCKLDSKAVEYYKTFYKSPERNERYRKAKISPKYTSDYSQILDKFYTVKGLLEKENKTQLPFTYVFDSFCHYFKVYIEKDFNVYPFDKFDKDKLIKYFKLFIKDYLDSNDIDRRTKKLSNSHRIRTKLKTLSEKEIKDFFLEIHSISRGSGSGIRVKNIKEIEKSQLIKMLDFIINSDLSMPQKYAVALTKPKDNGLKIDYLGESAIGEIPGWLLPEKYPIKNGKLLYVFEFFKI